MGVGGRGYIFSLIAALMMMVILSMALFQTQITSPAYDDSTNRMDLDEMHYYVESLKTDAERVFAISGQRAATYATGHVIDTNETFKDYVMDNCTDFKYNPNGSEAAIAELIVCGSLGNAKKDTSDVSEYMGGNTISSWISEIETNPPGNVPYNTTIRLSNMTMALYDPWHFVILSSLDISVVNGQSGNSYRGVKLPLSSIVDISSTEDPMYSVMFGVPQSIRQYSGCDFKQPVNGSELEAWIDDGCYVSGKAEYESPTFFDRLEGRDNLSVGSMARYSAILSSLNYTLTDIGLESLVDLDLLSKYNMTIDYNKSQVDYMYWSRQDASCSVDGMEEHPNFRIDLNHAREYDIKGLNCEVHVRQASQTPTFDIFEPTSIYGLPDGSKITFVEDTGIVSHTLHWTSKANQGQGLLAPGGRITWLFNTSGDYVVTSVPSSGSLGIFYMHIT